MMTPETPAAEPRYSSPIFAMTPCPPWCTRDHGDGESTHLGDRTQVGGFRSRPHDWISVQAAHPLPASEHSAPEVWCYGYKFGGARDDLTASFEPGTAAAVAGLVEMLAGATAAQHRTLAAALRAAAAAVAGGDGTNHPERAA